MFKNEVVFLIFIFSNSKVMLFDNKKFKVPTYCYVSVNNQINDADIYIEKDTTEEFLYTNCVAIFFATEGTDTRFYYHFGYFEKFSNDNLHEGYMKKYNFTGVMLFFKDETFLEDFKKTNRHIV